MSIDSSGATLYAMKISGGSSPSFLVSIPVSRLARAIEEGATEDTENSYGFGLHIMSNSWINNTDSIATIRKAIAYAYKNQVVYVAARGNYNPSNPAGPIDAVKYPACLDSAWVLNIGASGLDGEISPYSMYGHGVDVIAPGLNQLVRTVDGNPTTLNSYRTFSGTSASTPIVAGVAALMLSHHNHPEPHPDNLSPEDVEFIMKRYATDKDVPGWDEKTGAGLLDAGECIEKIKPLAYSLVHPDQSPVLVADSLIAAPQLILLTEVINDVPAGTQVGTKHIIKHTYQYTFSSPKVVLDGWSRPSSSNGFNDTIVHLPTNPHMEDFQLSVSGNTATVEVSTYAYYISALSKWIPDTPPAIKLPFSLHLFDSTFVGMDEQSSVASSLNAYPNPASNEVLVIFDADQSEGIEVQLYNSFGQMLSTIYEGRTNHGINQYRFSCAELASGIYFVRLVGKEKVITKEIMVIHSDIGR